MSKRLVTRGRQANTDVNMEKLERKHVYSFDKLYAKFYEAKVAEGLTKSTLDIYDRAITYFKEYLENQGIKREVRYVGPDQFRGFVVWLLRDRKRYGGSESVSDRYKKKGLSKRTAHDYLKKLKTFYKFLEAESYITKNPLDNVKNVKYVDSDIEVLSVEELRELFSTFELRRYADFRDYVILNLLLDTMCRIGEILSIKKDDIDFLGKLIHIKSVNTKTKKPRLVPMKSKTARLLRELIDEISVFETEYVFLVNYGEKMTTERFRKQLRKKVEKTSITKKVHPHLLRHTGATMFLESGGDLRHLQMILGHSDLRMVQRYTHLTVKSVLSQHDKYSPLTALESNLTKERKILR